MSNPILVSWKYDEFSFLKGNRVILNNLKYERLLNSVKNNNKTALNPIIVTQELEIIDGQHRFNVCRDLKLPIYYVVDSRFTGLNEVINLNTNQNSWCTQDFINSFVELNNINYIRLKQFMTVFKIGASTTIYIFKRKQRDRSKGADYMSDLKSGNLKITEEEYIRAVEFMGKIEYFNELLGIVDSKFIQAYIVLEDNNEFNHTVLLRKVSENPYNFTRKVSINGYKKMISEYYNYRKRKRLVFRDVYGDIEGGK